MRFIMQNDFTTVNTSSNAIGVPRLRDDRANWADYESKARTAMGAKGLIRHRDGTARKPVAYPKENGIPMKATGVKATDDDLEEKEQRFDEYEQKEYSAQHILLTMVSPRLATAIKSLSASEMWKAIWTDAI